MDSPLLRQPRRLLSLHTKCRLMELASQALALDNFEDMMALLSQAAAEVCPKCNVMLVQHNDSNLEVVTLLHTASKLPSNQAMMYQASISELESVQEACNSGQTILLTNYDPATAAKSYPDLDACYGQASGAAPYRC